MENRDENLREGVPPHRPNDPRRAGEPFPPDGADDDEIARPLTFTQWLAANAFTLTIVVLVLGYAIYRFPRIADQLSLAKMALGLSLVVFLHELGHFLVAKWCDVHVTTFSIGFGPAIPGCSFQWGETNYKLALFPLGGYVQMVGQVDGDESSDGSEDDPRSYRNKSVGQRMAIISAGVIMNVILAVVLFIVVFRGPGKERLAGVVGQVDTGAPAFKYGFRTGARILQIGDTREPFFEDLMVSIMATGRNEKVKYIAKLPSEPAQELDVEPRLDPGDTRPLLGVSAPPRLQLATRRQLDPGLDVPALPASSAANASSAFALGDRIVATSDPKEPDKITPLPDDPRSPEKLQKDFFEFQRRMHILAGRDVTLVVERLISEDEVTRVEIKVPPSFRPSLGARMQIGPIVALRTESPAEKAGIVSGDPTTGRIGDLIEKVEVLKTDGKSFETLADAKDLDPEKLPLMLEQWAQRLETAGVEAPWNVRLTVRRHRSEPGQQFEAKTLDLVWNDGWRFDRALPIGPASPLAVSALGLAYQVKTTVAAVGQPGSPLQPGDVVKNLRYTLVGANGEEKTTSWQAEEIPEGEWASQGYHMLHTPRKITKIFLRVERDKKIEELEITPSLDLTWPLAERGWMLMPDTRMQRADSLYEAVVLGMRDTRNSMLQVFQNLRGMLTLRVSPKLLGGPLMIANVAFLIAGRDFWEFLFFLGLISVNLAVVNFLPIPVLDGGHMVFLLYEKLRGKPASDAVRAGATYAGLALILSLFIFVMYLDVPRLFL